MLSANIKFFDIKRLGFYRRGQYEAAFGDVNTHFSKLKEWAHLPGRSFVNTITYQPRNEIDIYRTFFNDWVSNQATEDSLLILWNEIPNDGGVIYGMSPDAIPGQTEMKTTSFEDDAIPGMPSYFWILPEHNLIASIKFEHSFVGKLNMERYLKSYLCNFTLHGISNDNGEIIGFSDDGNYVENCDKIHAYLELTSKKDDHIRQKLLADREKITRFIRKERLDYSEPDTRGTVEKLVSKVLREVPVLSDKHDVNYSFHFKPTQDQLTQIIDNYNNLPEDSCISDIGFKVGSKTVMLSGLNISFEFEFNFNRGENEIIQSQILLDNLHANRARLLRLAQIG